MAAVHPSPSISVRNLTYTVPSCPRPLLQAVTLNLPSCSRTLLIGANGAGKSTLLRLLAGKRLAPTGTIKVGGLDPFSQGLEGVTYLGVEWVLNPIVRTDIGVPELLDSVGAKHYPDRAKELVNVLDIDLRWRMHTVSDGERRRVQLAMGLLRPWTVLLLDEVTVDLDLLSRSEFLGFLRRETGRRDCTIVYATHILDNLVGWPTHVVHLCLGKCKEWGEVDKFQVNKVDGAQTGNSQLGELVLKWLREDLDERGPRGGSENEEPAEVTTNFYSEGLGGYGLESRRE